MFVPLAPILSRSTATGSSASATRPTTAAHRSPPPTSPASAAMVIASKVLGKNPSPATVECQLEATARRDNTELGQPYDSSAGAGPGTPQRRSPRARAAIARCRRRTSNWFVGLSRTLKPSGPCSTRITSRGLRDGRPPRGRLVLGRQGGRPQGRGSSPELPARPDRATVLRSRRRRASGGEILFGTPPQEPPRTCHALVADHDQVGVVSPRRRARMASAGSPSRGWVWTSTLAFFGLGRGLVQAQTADLLGGGSPHVAEVAASGLLLLQLGLRDRLIGADDLELRRLAQLGQLDRVTACAACRIHLSTTMRSNIQPPQPGRAAWNALQGAILSR